jgi:hypothetical protein
MKTDQDKYKTNAQTLRNQLRKNLERFRELQATLTPSVASEVAAIFPDVIEVTPELQPLYTPSDYSQTRQVELDFGQIAFADRKMLEGAAYDTLEKIRTCVRLLSALVADEKSNAYSQSTHTRAKAVILDSTLQRDINLEVYAAIRSALLRLGHPPNDVGLRPLTLADTYRKPTRVRRAVGDTGRNDGLLWTGGFINSDRRQTHRPLINAQALDQADIVATQSSQNLKRKSQVLFHDLDLTSRRQKQCRPPAGYCRA